MLVAAADCSFLRGKGTGTPELLSAFMNPHVANWRERRKLFTVALNKAHLIPQFVVLIASFPGPAQLGGAWE